MGWSPSPKHCEPGKYIEAGWARIRVIPRQAIEVYPTLRTKNSGPRLEWVALVNAKVYQWFEYQKPQAPLEAQSLQ
jgi:hypothetical protein